VLTEGAGRTRGPRRVKGDVDWRRRRGSMERAHGNSHAGRVGVGEEEVDGTPDSKAKPWRRLVVAERRRNSGTTAVLSSVPAMARRRCWRSGWRLQSGEVGCRGRGGLIEDGAEVWAFVHGAIAAKIAAAQDAEETDRATVSRDPGLRWGSFWKERAHERLASGSCRAGVGHGQWGSGTRGAELSARKKKGRRRKNTPTGGAGLQRANVGERASCGRRRHAGPPYQSERARMRAEEGAS